MVSVTHSSPRSRLPLDDLFLELTGQALDPFLRELNLLGIYAAMVLAIAIFRRRDVA